ncbi:NAD(P)-dependent oxidoreductase [Salinisphaera sp. USBA-960]|nr:NAD(P)-dependent oxidoreductase [Salifodinibacter halophilus]NNC26229.1 NAD(P)-dependent oxidoreductase [Salifodinibacter halophilus]
MKVSVIGLGAMGSHIAANLLDAGYDLTVWNRTAASTDGLVEAGAARAESARDAFGCDVVLTTLFDDAAIRTVLLDGEALAGAAEGTIHVCMSTISTELVDDLIEVHRSRGIRYVAAPMFGRADMAAAAKLNMAMAGAPEDVEPAEPVLSALGQIWLIGKDPRLGHLSKIAGNFMIGCAIETMAESTALIESRGGDPAPFISMLSETLFASPVYKSYGAAIASGESPGAPSGLKLPQKDVGLTLKEGRTTGLSLPLAELLQDRLQTAENESLMDEDWSIALAKLAKGPHQR